MQITSAASSDIDEAIRCAVAAFAQDPITGFLLGTGPGYQQRLRQFFSLLMRARVALKMPVLVARDADGIRATAMGYATECHPWPAGLAEEWDRFEMATEGLTERMAAYDEVAARSKPATPHYYLGVIEVDPTQHGLGLGTQLLKSFCDLSAADSLSSGVYLETASPSNVRFYERAGFSETGRGNLGSATLWCMFLPHARHDA
jgi:ribosomal protein S18 acetylase RimI-like enzyme